MTAGGAGTFVYDRVAYPSPILPMITPPRLGGAVILNGYQPPPSETCAMLEIGCGDGLNLIGMAAFAPEGRFVGFDLSHEAIQRGRRLAEALGLSNVELHVGDATDYPRDGERFDYVVTHGLYAWVPEPVREAILALTAARLAPGGIAYLSYDCLPAAGPKQVINRYVNDLCGGIADTEERIVASVKLIATLARHQTSGSRLDAQLTAYAQDLPHYELPYIFHDVLADHYRPSTVLDVSGAAARHGLRIVGDGNLTDLYVGDLDAEAVRLLDSTGDDMAARLYALDMLRGANMFRRSLLVHDAAPPARTSADAIEGLWFSFSGTREPIEIDGQAGFRYSTTPDVMMAAIEAPRAPVLRMLWDVRPGECTVAEIAAATGISEREIADVLLTGCFIGLFQAHDAPPKHVAMPGDRPRASQLIRTMLSGGDWALTLRHTRLIVPQEMIRALLCLCDGTRTRNILAQALTARFGAEASPARIDEAIEDLRGRSVFEA